MSFDETQHPRGQAGNAGQFRGKANSAPAGSLRDRGSVPDEFYAVWDGPEEVAEDAYALGTLSAFAEPGDVILGMALQDHPPREVLRALTAGTDADDVARQLGLSSVAAERVGVLAHRAKTVDMRRVLEDARESGVALRTSAEDGIPVQFADLGSEAPHTLWVRGESEALNTMSDGVTITGARAATAYGEQVAVDLGAQLGARGRTLVSGGGYGIDGAAIRSQLSAGGRTVVLSAAGSDRTYPAGNAGLFERVVQSGGAIASESAPGMSPSRWRFLARGRLMAAASGSTVIVEAGARSGSLHVAATAAQIGRRVGAVPGPITSATSVGAHRLVREGVAQLVTCMEDVEELAR